MRSFTQATKGAAAEPTEKEKPKKKLILTPQDRIKLGKQLEPLLKPTLKCLVDQLEAAADIEGKTNKPGIFSKLSRGHGSDGSLASKAGRGAPPSADNNV